MTKVVKILLIEDDEAHVELIVRNFEQHKNSYSIYFVNTIKEAKRHIQNNQPDLILADWLLPDGKGIDLLTDYKTIPLILLTSFGNEALAVEVIKAGALDYIVKSPEVFSELPKYLKHSLREWELQKEHKQTQAQLEQSIKDLKLINQSITILNNCQTIDDIHEFLGKTILQLIDKPFVVISKFIPSLNSVKINKAYGFESYFDAIKKLTGFDIMEKAVPIDDMTSDELADFTSGKINEFEEGLYTFAARKVPKIICNTVAKILNIEKVCGIGFVVNNKLYGGITIMLRKGTHIENPAVIETIVNQASVVLQRKVAELAIKETEEQFKLTYIASPEAISITKINERIFIDVNDSYCELTGYHRNELIGKSVPDFNIFIDTIRIQNIIDEIEKNGIIRNAETQIKQKNGTIINCLISASIIKLNNERHFITFIRNIDEIKKYQNEIIKAKEKAEESDKLKSIFLANMSHEFRTPMNAIIGFSQLLSFHNLSEEKRESYISVIQQKGFELLDIINEVLDISKIESGIITIKESTGNIENLIKEIIDYFEVKNAQENKKHIKFIFRNQLSINQYKFNTDFLRLKQIIVNIVENAFKFTNYGYVELSVKLVDKDEMLFKIRDTGIGIAKEKQHIIFDRFRQADESLSRKYGGTGLGLAISKGLVDRLGGKIWLESNLYEGSSFYFSIPISFNHNLSDFELSGNNGFSLKNKQILIVENNSEDIKLISEVIFSLEGNAFVVDNDVDAYEMALEKSADLMFINLKLNHIKDFEAIQLFKQNINKLKIISLFSELTESEKQKSFENGCDDYLLKPLNPKILIEILERHIVM